MTTLDKLTLSYGYVLRLDAAHTSASDAATLTDLAAQVDAGTLAMSDALASIGHLSAPTTEVATLAYQFFVGTDLRVSGLDYLMSPLGPNPNNLNSPYYATFNTSNRYINFAVALGKLGEGASAFQAAYGSLSLVDTFNAAYTKIFGYAPSAGQAELLLNAQVSNGLGGTFTRAEYFAAYGQDGLTGIGTKAALVGWLLGDAASERLGVYSQAYDAYVQDLGANGRAVSGYDLVAAYGPAPAAQPGVTITVAHDQPASPTATDPLRRTSGDDTITAPGDLDGPSVIDAGGGQDAITVQGILYGTIKTSDGYDVVTLGGIGSTAPPPNVLGIPPFYYGALQLAGNHNTVYLNGSAAAGTTISAGGIDNTLHLNGLLDPNAKIGGFNTVYVELGYQTTVAFALPTGGTAVLSHTAAGAAITYGDETNAFIRLDHADGGGISIKGSVLASLTLQVDGDSNAGSVSGLNEGWSGGGRIGYTHWQATVTNLVITGPGSLTANVASFTSVDASSAGDLDLTYGAASGGVFKFSNGADIVHASFQYGSGTFVFGSGSDTVQVGGAAFSNLSITNGAVNPPTEFIGFKVGIDHLDLSGISNASAGDVQSYVQGAQTLTNALIQVSAHTPAHSTAVFTYGGDTYVYQQDEVIGVDQFVPLQMTGDGLIKLTGVTGVTIGHGTGFDVSLG